MSSTQRSKQRSASGGTAARAPSSGYALLKRALDVGLALVGLVLSSPVWVGAALVILLTDGPPMFFHQDRLGRGGKVFKLKKFRTMRRGENPIADLPPSRDPRLTRVGRLLRATALDEIPALLHILKGDMSFVGPKPLAPVVNDPPDPDNGVMAKDLPRFHLRVTVRPGLTGLAQVHAAKNARYRHKFRYDALYVDRMGLALDLKILALSFLRTFRGAWERVGGPG